MRVSVGTLAGRTMRPSAGLKFPNELSGAGTNRFADILGELYQIFPYRS